jgi:glucose/arabinose dehydrogenase
MSRLLAPAVAFVACALPAPAQMPPPIASGLKNPESACAVLPAGPNAKEVIYVTQIGEFNKDGDGSVVRIEDGKAVPFAAGLDDPKGICAFNGNLYVADKTKVLRIDAKGTVDVYADADKFPTKPIFLNDVVIDIETGILYVSDTGNPDGTGGAVYRLTPRGGPKAKGPTLDKITTVVDAQKMPGMKNPNGLAMDGKSFLLMVDLGTGFLHRIKIADGTSEKLAEGFGGADGVVWDYFGRLYISDWKAGKVFVINRPGDKPVVFAEGFQSAADIGLDGTGANILIPDMKAGTVTKLPIGCPGKPVDSSPLPLETEPAFPGMTWEGWQSMTDSGKLNEFRPLLLTYAGDGSHRTFVGTEHGVVYVLPDGNATKATVFLDIQDRVKYLATQNEEGFLGLAFHPKFKENGEVFVFYTPKNARLTNQISRFKVRKDDPTKADPGSEEVILKITKHNWNHDGGTILFGPDGYLYFTHGDGGGADDIPGNGQNKNVLLGKVCRIDVDHKDPGLNYAIPKDNPFVGQKDVRPEIWAYGVRNLWRMAFDRKTGQLWAGEVGQNLFEEINIIEKGGNFGWNIRESLHPFGAKGVGPRPDLIEPIWEYHHAVGKSITGGGVYRGTQFPELDGHFLYADYVSGKIWALKYDEKEKRVVANRPIKDQGKPIMSWGEDERGEMYLMTYDNKGQGVYRLKRQ